MIKSSFSTVSACCLNFKLGEKNRSLQDQYPNWLDCFASSQSSSIGLRFFTKGVPHLSWPAQQQQKSRPFGRLFLLAVRARRIELPSTGWKPVILPLNYARNVLLSASLLSKSRDFSTLCAKLPLSFAILPLCSSLSIFWWPD